ncbi:MAG: polyketide synthase dehydratase domain-containing protein [Deltaproteobacteria bacterium]|nr:polyketide synthase dehydratase domain-containing protein [Deltaproteobacteria bacterium]
MEIISQLNEKKRYSLDIEIYPYLRDHYLEGKVILPAVEILIIMAGVVKTNFPQININCLNKARFFRFLSISPDTQQRTIFVDIEIADDGVVAASLLTSIKSKTGTISRAVEHARVEFATADSTPSFAPPFYVVKKLKGKCISVPSTTIYRELVPFGAAYQNIVGDLSVSPEGAWAYLSGGDNEADKNPLGSPFPLDAVLHEACVWGQRFADIVSFPAGFEKRIINQKTRKGGTYLGRVVPVNVKHNSLIFDAWIYDLEGTIYESISGIQMRDVSQGRLRPPDWIKADL